MAAYTNTIGWENPYYKGKFGWQYTSSGDVYKRQGQDHTYHVKKRIWVNIMIQLLN